MLNSIIFALKKVFSKPLYIFISILVALLSFLLAILWQNIDLIFSVLMDPDVSFISSIILSLNLLWGITTNFSIFSAIYTSVISILLGINISLIIFYIKAGKLSKSGWAFSSGGLLAGIAGVGCAACGSLLLSALLPFIGGSAVLALLPLGGEEFGILAIILLIFSIFVISRQMEKNPIFLQ